MSKQYPDWICIDCGEKHGKGPGNDCCTMHMGVCGVCGKDAAVTEPRDFGHLKEGWNDDHR